jgi:hypothetical protein
MYRCIPAIAVVLGIAASAGAQDSTTRSKTKVSADDARTITLTGCLEPGTRNSFRLRGSGAVSGDDVTTKSKVEKKVDDNGNKTRTKSRTDIEHDGDATTVATYLLTPQAGVDLASHVGRRVHIIGVVVDPDEDDAEVEIKDDTKIERDGAPDVRQKSKKKIEVDRGEPGSVTVVSVKPIGGACDR